MTWYQDWTITVITIQQNVFDIIINFTLSKFHVNLLSQRFPRIPTVLSGYWGNILDHLVIQDNQMVTEINDR